MREGRARGEEHTIYFDTSVGGRRTGGGDHLAGFSRYTEHGIANPAQLWKLLHLEALKMNC